MGRMRMAAAGLMMAALAGTAGCASMRESMGMERDRMGMESGMQMSEADMRMMASCKAMTREAMMKNSKCMEMMRMHPEMMKDGMKPM